MNSKRSYLDTLNAGRQRRPHAALEELNRSLETLEQRLERTREDRAERVDPRRPGAEPRYASAQPYGQPRWYEDPHPAQRLNSPASAAPAFDQKYQTIARDIDRVRGQEDSVAVVGKIAGELRGLREELRHQMTVGLQREFNALRKDIERAFQAMETTDPRSLESIEADVAFHEAILNGTGNEFLAAFAPVIGTWLTKAFRIQRIAEPEQEHFVPQHRAIFEAIKHGDAEGARKAFRVLLTRSENDAMAGIRIRDKIDDPAGKG